MVEQLEAHSITRARRSSLLWRLVGRAAAAAQGAGSARAGWLGADVRLARRRAATGGGAPPAARAACPPTARACRHAIYPTIFTTHNITPNIFHIKSQIGIYDLFLANFDRYLTYFLLHLSWFNISLYTCSSKCQWLMFTHHVLFITVLSIS